MALYERICEIQAGDKDITGLRVSFDINADLKPEPNNSEIKIYNLSERTRGTLQKKGAKVQLTAGYRDNKSLLFLGEIRQVDHLREGPDWVSRLRLGDGDNFYKSKKAFSFKPGSGTGQVIESLAKMGGGISLGNITEFVKGIPGTMQTMASGLSGMGEPQKAMSSIADSAGYNMSVQNGALLFRRKFPKQGDFTVQAELLNEDTGLVGSPEHSNPDVKEKKPAVMKAKSLLNPRLRCGYLVKVESNNVKGTFVITKLTHKGDTHGGDWYTEIEALPI